MQAVGEVPMGLGAGAVGDVVPILRMGLPPLGREFLSAALWRLLRIISFLSRSKEALANMVAMYLFGDVL